MAQLTIIRGGRTVTVPVQEGTILGEALKNAGIELLHPCGGRGKCGKCAVTLEGAASEPNEFEIKAGSRLSCQAKIMGDCTVILPQESAMEQIETEGGSALRLGQALEGPYGAAVDIGTTTVALKLYDLTNGKCLASLGVLNPQTAVAADVMGRIGASMRGEREHLQKQITDAIATLLTQAAATAQIARADIKSMVVTGNTTMLYLLTGRETDALSHAPFEADCLYGLWAEVCGIKTYLPLCMHAFVGADITCAVLVSGQCNSDEESLLCDIGTNGELSLRKDGRLYVTSTAAGPAFEGAGISCGVGSVRGAIDKVWVEDGEIRYHTIGEQPAVGICGSGIIDAVAAGLETGFIDETGAMDDDEFTLCEGVSLSGSDIRAVQLAKAAIAAGIQTLLETAGVDEDEIGTLYIAGGFGSHLNARSAARIGLLPAAMIPRVKVIGNAALAGAAAILLDEAQIAATEKLVVLSEHVNLGGNPAFNENYMEQMLFPEE